MNSETNNIRIANWKVNLDVRVLCERVVETILRDSQQAIVEHGKFSIVLTGGNTVLPIYQRLRDSGASWDKWRVYFSDERCVGSASTDRNSCMVNDMFLRHVAVPAAHVHAIPVELGPEAGAKAYSEAIRGVDIFDLVLLSLGEDGHVASLFPGRDWRDRSESLDVVPVRDAPKLPSERVSLSAARLGRCRRMVVVAAGQTKCQAVSAWKAGARLPVASIVPFGILDVFVSDDATGSVSDHVIKSTIATSN